jgi:hypothetical protein
LSETFCQLSRISNRHGSPGPGETQTMICWASLQRNCGGCGLCGQACLVEPRRRSPHYSQEANPVLDRAIIATVSKFLRPFTL